MSHSKQMNGCSAALWEGVDTWWGWLWMVLLRQYMKEGFKVCQGKPPAETDQHWMSTGEKEVMDEGLGWERVLEEGKLETVDELWRDSWQVTHWVCCVGVLGQDEMVTLLLWLTHLEGSTEDRQWFMGSLIEIFVYLHRYNYVSPILLAACLKNK